MSEAAADESGIGPSAPTGGPAPVTPGLALAEGECHMLLALESAEC
jgi:hypothetical protein